MVTNKIAIFVLPLLVIGVNADFDYLTFAQMWPWTSCQLVYHRKCNTTGVTSNWTIHGLWPSSIKGPNPYNCNQTAKFDFSKIKSLESQLDRSWHVYDPKDHSHSFWKHEWDKHGTCAFALPNLRGEMNYFSRTLKLHDQIDTLRALEMSGIYPDPHRPYKGYEFYNALNKFYKVKSQLQCVRMSGGLTYLDQIYTCLDKSFKLRDCSHHNPNETSNASSPFHTCRSKDLIYYKPMPF